MASFQEKLNQIIKDRRRGRENPVPQGIIRGAELSERDPSVALGFANLLEIIRSRGATSSERLGNISSTIDEAITGFTEGLGGENQAAASIASQTLHKGAEAFEGQLQDQRQLQDLGLVLDGLIQPALRLKSAGQAGVSTNLRTQQNEFAQQQALFRGLGDILQSSAVLAQNIKAKKKGND